jgi:hypothetical protein
MDAHVAPSPAPRAARSWHITPVGDADLDEFTRLQCKAFIGTGNPLHDTLFPPASDPSEADFARGTARHRAALAAEPNNAVFVKVVDEGTGAMAGGAKWCFSPPRGEYQSSWKFSVNTQVYSVNSIMATLNNNKRTNDHMTPNIWDNVETLRGQW